MPSDWPVVVVAAFVLYIISSFPLQQVAGEGKLQVRLLRYDNPSGKGSNGHCCDGRMIFCEPRGCDHYFYLCLDRFYGTNSISSCSIGTHTTGSTDNEDNIQFDSSIGGTANPFEINFIRWDNGVKIKVHVWDEDPRGRHDFVDSLQTRVAVAAAGSESTAHWTPVTISARTSLSAELRVFCSSRYYGPHCNVYCRPGNQYDCDSSGQKVCRPGWTGSDCASVDACYSSPCQNGAQCHSEQDIYICSCPPGFTGRNCESGVNECASDTCQNGGRCHVHSNGTGYYCECPQPWTGARCETRIETCSPDCRHGECEKREGLYVCRCHFGWTGIDCSERDNSCYSNSCLNNATCVDDETGFTCICDHRFTGELCDVAIDDSFTSLNVTSDVIDTDDDSASSDDAERLFVFAGRLRPADGERIVVAISNHTKSQLPQLDCEHMIDVDYRLEYCTGKSGNDVTLFFFDVLCNSTRLNWSAVEEVFDSMSSEEFHQMLPMELSEDDDCIPGTRASSSALKSMSVTTWIVPTVIALTVVMLLLFGTFFIVRRYRRRRLSPMTAMSFEQPLYDDHLYLDRDLQTSAYRTSA